MRAVDVIRRKRDGLDLNPEEIAFFVAMRSCSSEPAARPWRSTIDPAVGVVLHRKVGDRVETGEPLLTVHFNERRRLDEALAVLGDAVRIAPDASAPIPLIREIVG